jgi:hypothetical protein
MDFVPPKAELPPTVSTVKVTDDVLFLIPDLLTVQGAGVVEQLAEPLAPLLHVPDTLATTGEPSLVTVTVTVAVQVDPAYAPTPLNATVRGAETTTLCDETPVAPSSSVVVRVTGNVPPDAYACELVGPDAPAPSPNVHA